MRWDVHLIIGEDVEEKIFGTDIGVKGYTFSYILFDILTSVL